MGGATPGQYPTEARRLLKSLSSDSIEKILGVSDEVNKTAEELLASFAPPSASKKEAEDISGSVKKHVLMLALVASAEDMPFDEIIDSLRLYRRFHDILSHSGDVSFAQNESTKTKRRCQSGCCQHIANGEACCICGNAAVSLRSVR